MASRLRNEGIITFSEKIRLSVYLRANEPKTKYMRETSNSSYWWFPRDWSPRRAWLSRQIKKLS